MPSSRAKVYPIFVRAFHKSNFHLYSLGGSVPEGAEGQINFLSPGPSFFGVIGSTALSRTSLSEPPRFLYLRLRGLASQSPSGRHATATLSVASAARTTIQRLRAAAQQAAWWTWAGPDAAVEHTDAEDDGDGCTVM